MIRITVWIFLFFVLAEYISFKTNAAKINYYYNRFELALYQSHINTFFYITFLLILVAFGVTIISFYMGNKSIYSVLSLPIHPFNIIFSFIVPCVINLVILFSLQILLIIYFGQMLPSFFNSSITIDTFMNNYILMGVIRFTPTSFLFPLNIKEGLKPLYLLITPSIAVAYGVFMSMHRKYVSLFFLAIYFYSCLYILASRFESSGSAATSFFNFSFLSVLWNFLIIPGFMYFRMLIVVKGRSIV